VIAKKLTKVGNTQNAANVGQVFLRAAFAIAVDAGFFQASDDIFENIQWPDHLLILG